MQMSNNKKIGQYLKSHTWSRKALTQLVVLSVIALALGAGVFGFAVVEASAQAACGQGETSYVVKGGDTLGQIGQRYGVSWQSLAEKNSIANANLIYINQSICIPGTNQQNVNVVQDSAQQASTNSTSSNVSTNRGTYNSYPYGQCTWYADQRFYETHGYYVPWYFNSNANVWADRAIENGWHVSSTPQVGDILVLSPGVQGASYLGHVSVVESVNGDGTFVASHMNWWPNYSAITYSTFSTGWGVNFVRP